MFYTIHPRGEGHAWVKRLFIDRQYRGSERAEDYAFIPTRLTDNPYLIRDKLYCERINRLPENLRKAYIDGTGDWNIPTPVKLEVAFKCENGDYFAFEAESGEGVTYKTHIRHEVWHDVVPTIKINGREIDIYTLGELAELCAPEKEHRE